jgi:hypothetical protein
MINNTLRNEFLQALDGLTDEQVSALLHVARAMNPDERPDYDEAKDPLVGFIDGPTDLASRAKDTLRDEIDARSGWTQKDKLE